MEYLIESSLESFKDFLSYDIKPYTSIQEKQALLKQGDGEMNPIIIAKILGLEPKNRFEAIAMIFKARENSVDDLIEFNFTCGKCKYLDIKSVSIADMFFTGDIDEDVPIGLFEEIEEVMSEDLINNLSIGEYNEFEQKVFKNNIALFDPAIKVVCNKCGHTEKTVFDISSIVSKTTLRNLYEQYMDIAYYSSMTKADVDGMLPFEREVFLGLIQKKEDEKAKAQNPNKQ